MRTLLILSVLLTGALHAEEAVLSRPLVPRPTETRVPGQALWRSSLATLATANALDIHSSWGKHELNRTLAGPSGNFGRDGAILKLGLQGGLMGIEWLITRRNPNGKLFRALSVINFTASGVIAGTAMHNYSVPRPR